MKTTSKILATLVLGSLLITSLYANYNNQSQNCMMNKSIKSMDKRINKNKMSILTIVKRLNLSKEQRIELRNIINENKINKKQINQAFSKSSFDKDLYIQMMQDKRDNMIKSKANLIEKVYSILTIEQKEQFKVLLDLKHQKRLKKGNI